MQQGICNPEFYGDLVNKFKNIIENPKFITDRSKVVVLVWSLLAVSVSEFR